MLLSLSILLLGSCTVRAQSLIITQPSPEHWWVANELDTLAWTAGDNPPQEFSVFLANPDPTILTSELALVSIEPLYEYSKTINPGNITPSTGYTIQLTDILNSTNVYATSEAFEIKPEGSSYPPQTTNSSSASSNSSSTASSGTSTPSSSGSASSQSNQTGSAIERAGFNAAVKAGGCIIGGLMVLEAMIGFM
ncbi:hypothetical protein BCR39DRAFT_586176 [Naematelia encephala]|uniref:Ser-Thr-rich glycosyl-phosphatidyl-inositol-anchored membrane family-domain-containing protein n=1 Tax=Naematelia encephala TaxID=71784 RepID=A0A1Y2BGS1_9TREE|nr:hypothetical protein BCR39DRAFT_586176 [Naematelia encephala]